MGEKVNMSSQEFVFVCKKLDLAKSEVLHRFETFDPAEWTIVRGTPKWSVSAEAIRGGGPDEPTHGQIFFNKPVAGDVVLEFDAKIVEPSYHDLVWFWNVDFDGNPWGAGYLGCLAGWWDGMAGIEKLPDYGVSAIAPSCPVVPGRTYRVISGSLGGSHFIIVDGKLVTYFADKDIPDPKRPGYFGFGIYESCAEYSNLTVYRPHWADIGERKYTPGTTRAVE